VRLRCRLFVVVLIAFLASACRWAGSNPSHLLLITVDTLRSDHLGCYGNPLGLTPNIDRLAERSTLFTTVYAAAPSTFPSVTAILTGRYPEAVGVQNNYDRLGGDVKTLGAYLRSRGWKTGAVVSNFVLGEHSGLGLHFDLYDATFPQMEAVRRRPERIAKDTTDAALAMLDRLTGGGSGPVFLWVHFQDPHGPYQPPGNRRARFLERERALPDGRRKLRRSPDVRGMGGIPTYQFETGHREVAYYRSGYDGEVSYMDEEVGRLLEGLSARGLMDSTVIAFTADHGEGLGEGDYWFAHGEYLTEPLLRVPLLVAAPGRPPARRDDQASLVDLSPTLLALLGMEPPEGQAGENLFAAGADRRARTAYFMTRPQESTVPRFGLARDGYTYVVSLEGGGEKERLIRRGNDEENLLAAEKGLSRELRAELVSLRGRFPREVHRTTREIGPEAREKLRSLGYVGP
jgi:arylsulfatase A-like enzyme